MQALGQVFQEALGSVLSSVWATSAVVFVATIVFLWVRSWLTYQPPIVLTYQPVMCGDVTLESLSKFDGRDFLKPLYFAVRGKVYDVTKGKDFYGPGRLPSQAYATTAAGSQSPRLLRGWVPHFCWQRSEQGISQDVIGRRGLQWQSR